jgi:hypothetical protein
MTDLPLVWTTLTPAQRPMAKSWPGGGPAVDGCRRVTCLAPLAVTVALRLTGREDEADEPHHLRGQILGPDMQALRDEVGVLIGPFVGPI